MDDGACLEAIRSGGAARQQALAVLFERHARHFYRRAKRIGVPERHCEDVVAESFVKLMETTVPEHANPTAYLYAVARSRAIDLLRRLGRQPTDVYDESDETCPTVAVPASSIQPLETRQCIEVSWAELERTHPQSASVLELLVCRGLSTDEAAEIERVKKGTLAQRLLTARRRLESLISSVCPDLLAGLHLEEHLRVAEGATRA